MSKENIVTLEKPIKRGEQEITSIEMLKPTAGTLRGVGLAAVANADVDAMIKVLPRVTMPSLTEQEVAALDLPDFLSLSGAVIRFLSPSSAK